MTYTVDSFEQSCGDISSTALIFPVIKLKGGAYHSSCHLQQRLTLYTLCVLKNTTKRKMKIQISDIGVNLVV